MRAGDGRSGGTTRTWADSGPSTLHASRPSPPPHLRALAAAHVYDVVRPQYFEALHQLLQQVLGRGLAARAIAAQVVAEVSACSGLTAGWGWRGASGPDADGA